MIAEVDAYLAQLAAAQATGPQSPSLLELREWYRQMIGQSAAEIELPRLARREMVSVELAGRKLRALLQVPEVAGPPAIVVYFHGGGYAVGDCEATEPTTAAIAATAGAAVLSVDYRLAPEHPFPAAHDDAVGAVAWLHRHGEALGLDPRRVAVAGDSSGAALALHVAIQAAEDEAPRPRALALFYGWYDAGLQGASMAALGPRDPVLPSALMEMFRAAYFADADLGSARRRGLDPAGMTALGDTCVIVGGRDPLCSDSEQLAETLRATGTNVEYHRFDAMPHGFATVPSLTDGRRSVFLAGSFLASRLRADMGVAAG